MQFFLVLHLNKKQRIMEINKILSADILDILFDGRNKEYGAYELRKSYNKRITYALVATFAAVLLLFVGSLLPILQRKKLNPVLYKMFL
jgi:protein TonB